MFATKKEIKPRGFRFFVNGQVVYETHGAEESVEEARQRVADSYCHGMVENVLAVPIREPAAQEIALSN